MRALQIATVSFSLLLGLTACDQKFSFRSLPSSQATFSGPQCSDPINPPAVSGPLDVVAGRPATYTYPSSNEATWIIQFPDGERTYIGSPLDITFNEPGSYATSVHGRDSCGNEQHQNIVITVYPAIENPGVQIASGAAYTRQADVGLQLWAQNASEMYVTNDSACEMGGEWEPIQTEKPWTLMGEGKDVAVYVRYRTPAESTDCLNDTIIYDKTPPTVKLTAVPAQESYQPDARFAIDARDEVSGLDVILCSVDSGAYQVCQPEVLLKDLTYGTHRMRVMARDLAGNVSEEIKYGWTYINTPPRLTLTSTPSRLSADNFATFAFTAEDDRGPVVVRCSLDAQTPVDCVSPTKYVELANGEHQFSAQAFDASGLASEPVNYFWTVNHVEVPPQPPVPPVVYLTKTPDTSTYEVNADFEFRAQASDSGVKNFVCRLDAGAEEVCASPKTYSALALGAHSFSVYVIDNEGLRSDPVSYDWEILEKKIPVTDQFVVDSSGKKLDVVIVIDNSASMWEEQRKMADRFSTFVESLSGLDWQLGIITTDARSGSKAWKDGRLVPFVGLKDTYVINAATPDLNTVFEKTIRRKETGTSTEEGIHSLLKAIQRPSNRFLIRQNSHVASIIVSDEDERSNGKKLKPENTPENLIQTFKNLYGETNTYSNHSIVLQEGAESSRKCPQVGDFSPGRTYMKLSTLTGGIVGDLCADDYGAILKGIGDQLQQNAYTVKLKCEPKGDVTVQINPKPDYTVSVEVVGDKLNLKPYPPIGSKVDVSYYCD